MHASPGEAPKLSNGWGNISFSHCSDALLIGWSPEPLGVDIERTDRSFAAMRVAKRYLSKEEQSSIKELSSNNFRIAVLEYWLAKEAAIKWQRGSIAADLCHWSIKYNSDVAIHKIKEYQVKTHRLQYKNWSLAIASNFSSNFISPVICIGT